ncbi:MAG: hypothetical protein ACLRWM_03200 [Streptococcus sp.]
MNNGVKVLLVIFMEIKDFQQSIVEGLSQIRKALDLIEFDQLKHVDLMALFACFQGCMAAIIYGLILLKAALILKA